MLKERVITALIVAIVFLYILFYAPWYVFVFFSGSVFTAAAWEWSGLAGLNQRRTRVLYAVSTTFIGLAICGLLYLQNFSDGFILSVMGLSTAWWLSTIFWLRSYPSKAQLWSSKIALLFMGWFVLLPAWVACIYLLQGPVGSWLVLLVVLVVACADIGAFFTGRKFGQRKLAPRVSPAKSWEGLCGGVVFAVAFALVFNSMFAQEKWLSLVLMVVFTALVSVVGDLLESMVKRFKGVKDSGHLLPGHGGVLDRIDGLVAALPAFALLHKITQWSP